MCFNFRWGEVLTLATQAEKPSAEWYEQAKLDSAEYRKRSSSASPVRQARDTQSSFVKSSFYRKPGGSASSVFLENRLTVNQGQRGSNYGSLPRNFK